MYKHFVWFKELESYPLELVGGKALNLGKMFKAFPIPNGYCITADMYRKYVDTGHIAQQLATMDLDNIKQTKETAETIQQNIRRITLDATDEKRIHEFFDELHATHVAVRSSGTAEDLPNAAFAGQHDTYLNVTKEHIIEKIIECFASLYATRAIYYRDMKKITGEVAIAIVIQAMIDSDVSGVMYTKNPTTGSDEIIIEATHGLGEMIVSGKVEPDKIVVKHDSTDYRVGAKQLTMTREGIRENSRANERTLSDESVKKLVEYAHTIEKHFGAPQDIEFAIANDAIYILQSRNLTTIQK